MVFRSHYFPKFPGIKETRLETRGPKDCNLCNLTSNNSLKNFVKNKSSDSYELVLMGILERQWGYQFLDGVFDETHEPQWGHGILDGVLGN